MSRYKIAQHSKKLKKEFLNISNISTLYTKMATKLGLDIGGSLCKITLFESKGSSDVTTEFIKKSLTYGSSGVRDPGLQFDYKDGTFHFMHFLTRRMDGAIELIKKHNLKQSNIPATGGGAHKFAKEFKDTLDTTFNKIDELDCLIAGLNFLLENVRDECYYLETPEKPLTSKRISIQISESKQYPYLLVNIGSGVSILRVDSETSFTRVGGSCIGGGTYWGLCRLLTKANTFEDTMKMCTEGDHNKVDMSVGDIYGGDYEKFSLPSTTVASSFGHMVMNKDPEDGISKADMASSLLHMIGGNIAQIAYLTAVREKTKHVIFAGNFLRHNPLSLGFIGYSIKFWSNNDVNALFLKHEGYFGSIGALIFTEKMKKD
jgi:type II pantothenate kinase